MKDTSSSLWSCTGHTPVSACLCCTGEPCTGPSTPDIPHQCCAEAKDDLPRPALPSAAHDAVGLLCSKGTLLSYLQLVRQDPQVLFCKAVLQLFGPQPVLVHGVVPPQVLDLAFALLIIMKFLSAHFSSPPRCLRMAVQLSGASAPLLSFVSSASLLSMYSGLLSRSLMEM